jgi:hypothetical protein
MKYNAQEEAAKVEATRQNLRRIMLEQPGYQMAKIPSDPIIHARDPETQRLLCGRDKGLKPWPRGTVRAVVLEQITCPKCRAKLTSATQEQIGAAFNGAFENLCELIDSARSSIAMSASKSQG